MRARVADLGEHAIIERIRNRVPPAAPPVLVGIGDDAAVLEPENGTLTIVTTDGLVEGTHFDRTLSSAADIGHKALAVNLSDLAAMGATPRHALLSMVLPPAMLVQDVDQMIDALLALAARHRTTLVGGNITASASTPSGTGPLVVDVTAIGCAKRRRVLTRAGARPGDIIYLSGTIGAAAAGLESLQRAKETDSGSTDDRSMDGCRQRYRRPEPRVRLGAALGRNRAARACIDLSDGLGDAVLQLAVASDVGARINADAVPIHPEARAWFMSLGTDPVANAVSGGEDYELAFTAPQAFRKRLAHVKKQLGTVTITEIGVVTKEPGVVLHRDGIETPLPAGFEHFAK